MGRQSILIVEDEVIIAMELRETLEHLGYTVVGNELRGEDAVRSAGKLRPDVVLMDIHLKGEMDGIEASDLIARSYDIPVIYMTAHSDQGTLSRAIRTQPYGYIIKPFNERDLYSNIEMALHKHRVKNRLDGSPEMVDSAINMIAGAMVITDPQGRIERLNLEAERLTGYQLSDVEGVPFFTAFGVSVPGRDLLIEKLLVSSEYGAGSMISFPSTIRVGMKSGGDMLAHLSTALIQEKESLQIQNIACLIEPYTPDTEGRAGGYRSAAALVQAIPDPFACAAEDGGVILFNDLFSSLCERLGHGISGVAPPITRVLPESFIGSPAFFHEILADNQAVTREKMVKYSTGSIVYAIRYLPVGGDTGRSSRCVALHIRDVTAETLAMRQCERALGESRNTDAAIEGIGELCAALKETVLAMSRAYEKGPAFHDMANEQLAEANRILGDVDLRLIEIEKNRRV
ncbi:response regulator [Methanogenium sp. MK-MG]|uniref:ATP-binding response regulator n=1 Tax=Methanogenium sp. MK-MG TaxID=2599926 RepID=UPI0013EA791A|nr:response regulator [Methanogenium sp. MK-MG]KAF1078082.1 Chemotaxis response regulator protein-glutamate methylesterase [Methanogenium sp. MK-MG]